MAGPEYWNHNTAYHPWILDAARLHGGDMLDVGCGEGLLVERLAAVSRSVTGIEPDGPTAARARERLAAARASESAGVAGPERAAGPEIVEADFLTWADAAIAAGRRFDLVVFVASLHHMDLAGALGRAAALLRPGGEVLVVGLATNRSVWDWVSGGLRVPVVRWMGRRRGETWIPGVPVKDPSDDLRTIRRVAAEILPGVRVRRGLYYRYLLRGRAPGSGAGGVVEGTDGAVVGAGAEQAITRP